MLVKQLMPRLFLLGVSTPLMGNPGVLAALSPSAEPAAPAITITADESVESNTLVAMHGLEFRLERNA